jgi:hypothetical protein
LDSPMVSSWGLARPRGDTVQGAPCSRQGLLVTSLRWQVKQPRNRASAGWSTILSTSWREFCAMMLWPEVARRMVPGRTPRNF